jgi:hypothetical protein
VFGIDQPLSYLLGGQMSPRADPDGHEIEFFVPSTAQIVFLLVTPSWFRVERKTLTLCTGLCAGILFTQNRGSEGSAV